MKKMKWLGGIVAAGMVAAMIANALPQHNALAGTNNGYYGKKAKYVFYFIGDGMGMPQINSAEIFKGTLSGNDPMNRPKLNFTVFPNQGTQATYSNNTFITESAAAGTALATGHKTNNDVLGMDATKTVKFKSMAEMAKEKGMKVGIVSTVSIDHATPGAFYSHQPSRKNAYEIGVEMVNSGFDYFAGGSLLQPAGAKKDKTNVFDIAKQNGYKVANTKEAISALSKNDGKVIAVNQVLAADEAMPYDIDRADNDLNLADYTKKGIELLDNPNGFFMMVEGGKIDWACHANDAASTISDTVALDDSVKEAIKFYNAHPDETLILVTADHETGGLTIGFAGTDYDTFLTNLDNQKISYAKYDSDYVSKYKENKTDFNAVLTDIQKLFGLVSPTNAAQAMDKKLVLTEYELNKLKAAYDKTMSGSTEKLSQDEYVLYGTYEPLTVTITHILNNKSGVSFSSYAHTGLPVEVCAMGVGQDLFKGYYDNTNIYFNLAKITGVK